MVYTPGAPGQARYLSGLTGGLAALGEPLRRQAAQVGMARAARWIGISDGGAGIEDFLRAHFPLVEAVILDFWHAAQHVAAWAQVIAEYRKLVSEQPADGALLTKLAAVYQSAGRTREAVPLLAEVSAANPKDTLLSLTVAALQAWFGQDRDLAATRQRVLAFARRTNDAATAERAVRACSILPSADRAELEAVLALAGAGVKIRKSERTLLALGMAEYRSGNHAAADRTLLAAGAAGKNLDWVTGSSAFYRAMGLFRQGKPDEACNLASAAAATMKPLPRDENNPLAGNGTPDDLILWLAYKEAKAMIKFDAALPPQAGKDKK